MENLNLLIELSERLKNQSRRLKLSYKCDVVFLGYSAAETRTEDGKDYHYPEMIDLNIENWSTWKGSFRLSDGRFIREGMDLHGPGISRGSLYRRMVRELEAHAERIALYEEAHATNSVVFNGMTVVVENADAREFGPERVFEIFNEEGKSTSWYGRSAEDALSNAAPYIREFKPVLMRLKEEVSNECA